MHRILALAFIPNSDPEDRTQVNHKNGIKTDNSLENLEWVTPGENVRHAVETGTIPFGEDHWSSKLSNEDVKEIHKRYSEGETQYALADEFGVCQQLISMIVTGKKRRRG